MKREEMPPAGQNLSAGNQWTGKRIDLFLADNVDELSRSRAQKLIEEELVTVNGNTCRDKNYRLQTGDRISFILPTPVDTAALPEDIKLNIIYEDEDLLVINKERGMVVHPAPGHSGGTLVNALLNHCDDLSGIGGVIRPGIVHRLDKDTSGLLIVAKNDAAHSSLSAQLKERTLRREYLALLCGRVKPVRGRIEAPIGRHPRHRKKMAVLSGGREAVTRYRVIKYYGHYSLVRLKLETGRTHQIRVHMANLGFPVVGDFSYGPGSFGDLPDQHTQPQALHAQKISFIHPRTGNKMEFTAPLPPAFRNTIHWLYHNIEK